MSVEKPPDFPAIFFTIRYFLELHVRSNVRLVGIRLVPGSIHSSKNFLSRGRVTVRYLY